VGTLGIHTPEFTRQNFPFLDSYLNIMLEAKLTDGQIFKKIVDAIKELVNEANFDCNAAGITLQAMDTTHVALATLLLKQDGFDSYRCDRNISLGINMTSLTKILKSANSNDSITFRAEDSGDTLGLTFESPNAERVCDYELKLMALDTEHLGIPDQLYDAMIGMGTSEFSKVIRDLSTLDESCEIVVENDTVKFFAKGEIGSGSISINSRDAVDKEDQAVNISAPKRVSTKLSLKFLNIITKAAPLSDRVIMGITEDQPVSIEYKISDIGHLRYYLAPKVGDD
jgi:proliferating cell nuclear antigen